MLYEYVSKFHGIQIASSNSPHKLNLAKSLFLSAKRRYLFVCQGRCFSGGTSVSEGNVELQERVSTAIIGGGISGTSLAYHLAKQGQKNVLLLEKAELTSGSTWHAAGLTTLFSAGVNLKKIHYYSMNLYSKLAKETGQDIGMHQCGSIRLAFTEERLNEWKYHMSRAGMHAAPQCLLTPDQVKEMVPLVTSDKLLMGIYLPNDGYVDPYSLTQALAKGARNYGAQILQHTKVTSLRLREDGRWTVLTERGEFLADRVVNAAGFYSREIAKMAGHTVPTLTNQHQYVVTTSMKEVQDLPREMPVLRHMEASAYIRQERDGILIGIYEDTDKMVSNDEWNVQVPKDFDKELHPSDMDRLMPHLERIIEDIPSLTDMKIQSIVNGPMLFSPDGLPLVGPEDIPNFWTFSGVTYGIIHGGGMGKFLADWIQNGEAPFELSECDPTRFHNWATEKFILEKSRESYGMMNAVNYPHEERFAGRPTERVTLAHDLQKKRGAHMEMTSGWERPAWFALPHQTPEYKPSFFRTNWHESIAEEWKLVKSRVGITDLCSFAKFVIQGEDAAAFLDFVTANSVPRLKRTTISHMLTPGGKVYAELTITQTDKNRFFVITGGGSEMHDLRWLNEMLRKGEWNVQIENVTDDIGCLSVAGPKSIDVLAKLNNRFKEAFPFFYADQVDLDGINVTALRLSFTGELGWELYFPIGETGKLYERLIQAGEEFRIGDFGSRCMDVLRIEKGFKCWGTEMNLDKTPIEAGLMNFINLKKNSFVGKESVMRDMQNVPPTELVLLELDSASKSDPHGDETIWTAGRPVGNTTSGAFSVELGSPIAYAYVPPFLATPGTNLQVELVGDKVNAKVMAAPPSLTYNARLKEKGK